MLISITYFKVKNVFRVFGFLKLAMSSFNEAGQAKGLLFRETSNKGLLAFYTLTAWENEDDMLNYIKSGTHAKAMFQKKKFEAESATLRYTSDEIPSMPSAINKIKSAH